MTPESRAGVWLIGSAVILLGISYGRVYLFHLVLPVMWGRVLVSWRLGGSSKMHGEWSLAPFALWTVAGFLWAGHPGALASHCLFLFFGFSILFAFQNLLHSEEDLAACFKVVAWVIAVEYAISLLEGFGLIRLPMSMFSPWATYFGREPFDVMAPWQQAYVVPPPTAFMGNPNNLAFVLNSAFPFILLSGRRALTLAGALAHIVIILLVQSRVAYVVCAVELVLGCIMLGRSGLRTFLAISVLVLGTAVALVVVLIPDFDPAKTLSVLDAIQRFVFGGGYEDDSIGVRRELLSLGWEKLKDSMLLGIGAGGFAQEVAVQYAGGAREISDLHNFWMQLLVEGGIVGFVAYAWFHTRIIWGLVRVRLGEVTPRVRYYARSSLLALCGGVLGVVGMSGAYYVLPFWVILGFSLATVRIAATSRPEPAGAPPVATDEANALHTVQGPNRN